MNELSALKKMGDPRKGPLNRSKLSQAFVFAIIMAARIVVGAQAPATASDQRPQQVKTSAKVVKSYVCPMHPAVKSTRRGKCPQCGMDLRLAHVDTSVEVNSQLTADQATSEGASPGAASNASSDSAAAPRKMVIPEVEVLDQNGARVHFYSDLIKGKTVVINFIFTTCTTICPPLAATFARVQKEMGDKAGRDVHFISISVDPLTDTPERLKTWGAKFKAGPGWTFVTGDKQEIDKLLNALGSSVARREDHSPMVIVGNDLKGIWTRAYGLGSPTQLVGLIQRVLEGKTDESVAKEPGKQ